MPRDRLTGFRRLRIAARREHDADQFSSAESGTTSAEDRPRRRPIKQRQQRFVDERQNHLRLGIAEAGR